MFQQIRTSLTGPMDTVPVLRAHPRVLLHSLRTATRPLAALVVTCAFVGFVAPQVNRSLARQFVPEQSLLGRVGAAFRGDDHDARRDRLAHTLDALAWVLGSSLVLALYWVDLPRGVQRATCRAQRHAALAEEIARRSATEGLRLYERALALETDPGRIDALTGRIHVLRSQAVVPGDSACIGGRYRILEKLAHGANGVVHRARDERLDRLVALKELSTSGVIEADRKRFRQEALALARLSHPHVVSVYDLVEDAGKLWIAMELVPGGDLAQYLHQHGRLTPEEAVRFTERIADALAFAHDQNIVHRDLKAMNVLLTADGQVKVADFGTAKLDCSTVHTLEGTVIGSPHCMSPEQVRGEAVDERTDVYALGILLYQMLLGRPPFEGDLASVLSQHLHRDPLPVDEQADSPPMPHSLRALVMRMIKKDRNDRPASMHDVRSALLQVQKELHAFNDTAGLAHSTARDAER